MSIKKQGKTAEYKFQTLFSHAVRLSASADYLLGPAKVEVKLCKASTVNQVRPISYSNLVVWTPNRLVGGRKLWYVLPAIDIIKISLNKYRGQHTSDPFSCISIFLPQYPKWSELTCFEDDLEKKIEQAYQKSVPYEEICTEIFYKLEGRLTRAVNNARRSLNEVFNQT